MPSSPFKVLHPELNHAHLFKQCILPEAEDEEKAAITGPKGGEEMLQGERCESKCGRMEQGCPWSLQGEEVSGRSLRHPSGLPSPCLELRPPSPVYFPSTLCCKDV